MNNEIYLAFHRFLGLLNQSYGDLGNTPCISFDPRTAIFMTDVINNFSLDSFNTQKPNVDLFNGCTIAGVKLGVFMSQKELDAFNNSIKEFANKDKSC